MSEVAGDATVRLLIADFAKVDDAGKLNVIGGGVTALGYVHELGATAAFAVVMSVTVPARHVNAECSAELVLEDSAGNPVSLPGPAGEGQLMRIGQAIQFVEPRSLPGIPRLELPIRQQWVVAFANGLPLSVGQRYVWRVKIDHETRDWWTEEFFVLGARQGPVLG